MKYLIDTNIFIFLVERNWARISQKQLEIIKAPSNELLLCEASLFEMAIKFRMGKPDFSAFNMKGIEKDRSLAGIKIFKSKISH